MPVQSPLPAFPRAPDDRCQPTGTGRSIPSGRQGLAESGLAGLEVRSENSRPSVRCVALPLAAPVFPDGD